jgi:hypothetical protein
LRVYGKGLRVGGVDRGRPSRYAFLMAGSTHRTLDAVRTMRGDPDAIVEAGELVDMRFPSGGRMSLRGGKLFHLLVQAVELIDELHTTTLKLKLTDAKGRRFTKSGPILSDVEREEEDEVQAEVRFQFSPTLRKAIANSSHWAVISKRAVLAFESRYSLRLYTVLSLRAGLRKTAEDFTTDDLRELLGVPAGKLSRWQDLKTWALDPAIAEVNQLAGFHAGFVPIKRGRRIVGVTLTWGLKDHGARVAAIKELDRPKVGRKARRDDRTDIIVEAEGRQRELLATALTAAGSQDAEA